MYEDVPQNLLALKHRVETRRAAQRVAELEAQGVLCCGFAVEFGLLCASVPEWKRVEQCPSETAEQPSSPLTQPRDPVSTRCSLRCHSITGLYTARLQPSSCLQTSCMGQEPVSCRGRALQLSSCIGRRCRATAS